MMEEPLKPEDLKLVYKRKTRKDQYGKKYTEYNTYLEDDVSDGITVYYDHNKHQFTDNGYLEYEFQCLGLKLKDYRDQLNQVINYSCAKIDKNNKLVLKTKHLDDSDLASICQALTDCFMYLRLLCLSDEARTSLFIPKTKKQ